MLKRSFILCAVLPAFVFPFLASAESVKPVFTMQYSEAQLVELIAKLQKQLAEIRSGATQCTLPEVDLSIGDGEGDNLKEHVKVLQKFLKEKGFLSTEPTGYFGKLTKNALIKFQTAQGLTPNGELSAAVREKVKTLQCVTKYMKQEVKEKKVEWKEDKKEFEKEHQAVAVRAITLTGTGKIVTWTADGYAKNGFKVVWSKTSGPTYPTRDGDKYIYTGDPKAQKAELEAFSGAGVYKVRVCEYLGGTCGVYSNEIEVQL